MTQFRADEGLAFMLQYENVAWYDAGEVRILDRRIYPAKIEFVRCKTHVEVMQAIRDMVTQSAGPYTAAAMGMALAAYECRGKTERKQLDFLRAAAETISTARPTTVSRMRLICEGCLRAAERALASGEPVDLAIRAHAVRTNNSRYEKVDRIGGYLSDLFPASGAIMTQCFGETIVGMMLRHARQKQKDIRIFCPETRPYFQGARLTATVCRDMTAMSSIRSARSRLPSPQIIWGFRRLSPARRISATRQRIRSASSSVIRNLSFRPWAFVQPPRASGAIIRRLTSHRRT